MSREEKPDYGRCVSIVAQSALREMIKPGVLAVGGPVAVGVVFRLIGRATGQELLGARAVAGMLMFATVAGILMALFLNTAGGAWDNAKKYVETGAHGGKNSEAHKAAVTGDTVGEGENMVGELAAHAPFRIIFAFAERALTDRAVGVRRHDGDRGKVVDVKQRAGPLHGCLEQLLV